MYSKLRPTGKVVYKYFLLLITFRNEFLNIRLTTRQSLTIGRTQICESVAYNVGTD